MKFISGIIAVLLLSCHQMLKPKLPDVRWDLFDSPAAMPLKGGMRQSIEGIYGIEGENNFGPAVALKWSYTMSGKDTLWHLSMFCEASVYFICEGKKIDSNILLKGYWRRITTRETGTARFVITPANGAAQLLAADTSAHAQNIAIEGSYGKGDDNPDHPVHLRYIRPLYNKTALEIVAHRGGGRIGDLLPASENSVELIVMASRLGATGVEIDVQITKDGVPVLYHDDRINDRLTKKTGVQKKLSEYSYAELSGIPLKNGEKIPTLQQALYTIVHHTPLQYIWLDAKDTTMMEKIKDLQFQTLQQATSLGRKLEITIGIHDENVLKKFLLLPGFKKIPSLCELDPAYVTTINAHIWAPLWTDGLQKEKVKEMHQQGRKAFVWTVDQPEQIIQFMNEGEYDGMVSNYTSLVAYYHYSRQ